MTHFFRVRDTSSGRVPVVEVITTFNGLGRSSTLQIRASLDKCSTFREYSRCQRSIGGTRPLVNWLSGQRDVSLGLRSSRQHSYWTRILRGFLDRTALPLVDCVEGSYRDKNNANLSFIYIAVIVNVISS
nr:hypothetical protein CFP56_01145 [Quercus suber]